MTTAHAGVRRECTVAILVLGSRGTRREPMRAMAMTAMTLTIGLLACGNAEEEGRRAAQAKAAAETKQEVATQAAVKINPPVPGRAHIPCTQLIDAAQFTEALA